MRAPWRRGRKLGPTIWKSPRGEGHAGAAPHHARRALDDNVLPVAQEKFVKTYKAAGGNVEYHLFEKAGHEWVAEPGPQTDKARETVKAFIARQLKG